MKYVYVAFSHTNTVMGKMIRFFIRNEYNHVSLSFDEELGTMYSFARYRINSPFAGGFVCERPERYLSGSKDARIKLCRLPVSDEEYARIRQEIVHFTGLKSEMLYNSINAVLSLLNKHIYIKNAYTCIEFVSSVLAMEDIRRLGQLEEELGRYQIYCGSISRFPHENETPDDVYFSKRKFVFIVSDTVCHFYKIVSRLAAG